MYLNFTDKDNMVVKIILMFWTAVHFFSDLIARRLKHGSSYVKMICKGNKNYFGSRYRVF